ncbi:UNC93-like protein MFSD11 [Orchesella cincta]|uniref:UNC93-like protein MFSD11 n=1 Tax=Orchesella cincta TaxID=48709 RepID=A0A1D2MCT1_ORCCI|nr:UNC93-like protein MFSD11 [Orchesella cincta]
MLPRFLSKREIFQDGKFLQILLLSVSFMLVFTAFQTTSMTEQTVLASVRHEDPEFTGDGYVSLCIIYAVFAIGSWFAPSIVAIIGPKWGMVMSASVYLVFIAQFIAPSTAMLYLTSALLGGAASVLWCCQGNFLTLASDPKTISRNSGVFWGINQCSLFFGNLFVFFKFQGKTVIDSETRVFVFIVLTIVSAVGVLSMFLLSNLRDETGKAGSTSGDVDEDGQINPSEIGLAGNGEKTEKQVEATHNGTPSPKSSPFQLAKSALVQALRLFITPHMILLSIASVYTGWCQSFFFGVYPTAVGFTQRFGDAKRLVGLVGIFTGVGEVVGGSVFGLLGSKTTKKGRSPIVFLGLITHITCFVLVYLNLPEESTIRETSDASVFENPVPWLAVVCAMFMGFGDSCYQTQLFAIFGSVYADKSAAAFAIFKFTQSAASAIAFFSSSYMGMLSQMLTLLISSILGFLGIFIVELQTKRKNKISEVENSSASQEESTSETHPVTSSTDADNIRDKQLKAA